MTDLTDQKDPTEARPIEVQTQSSHPRRGPPPLPGGRSIFAHTFQILFKFPHFLPDPAPRCLSGPFAGEAAVACGMTCCLFNAPLCLLGGAFNSILNTRFHYN